MPTNIGKYEVTAFTLPIRVACPARHLYFKMLIANCLSSSIETV